MPKFFYTTVDNNGKEISGTVEASDINTAAGNLRGEGKIITSLNEISDLNKENKELVLGSFFDYLNFIRSSDIVIMFRQLSVLITAGITLISSLQILQRQTKKKK